MILYFLCVLIACNSKTQKENTDKEVSFKTRADTEIFFKNVRQLYYDVEIQENTKLNLYRFKTRKINPKEPILDLTIAHNWRYSEAYILVNLNEFFEKNKDLTVELVNKSGKKGSLILPKTPNKAQYFTFAKQMYEAILKENKMTFKKNGQDFNLFPSSQHSEVFRKVMVDYLRLVGNL